MPRYNLKIETLIDSDQFDLALEKCNNTRDRAFLALEWLTGARPGELMLARGRDVFYGLNTKTGKYDLIISLWTLKRLRGGILTGLKGKKATLKHKELINSDNNPIHQRHLVFSFDDNTNAYARAAAEFAAGKQRDEYLFNVSQRQMLKIFQNAVYNATGLHYTPYHIRHAVYTYLGWEGKTLFEIQAHKGSASFSGLDKYTAPKEFVIGQDSINSRKQTNKHKDIIAEKFGNEKQVG